MKIAAKKNFGCNKHAWIEYLWNTFERGQPEWFTILTNWNTYIF